MALRDQIRIMVVDDMSTSRGLITQALDGFGIQTVYTSDDGAAALVQLQRTPVHLVISDYNMPNMDGLKFLHHLRSQPETQKIGFILITGRAEQQIIDYGRKLGMNNYLKKPFEPIDLRRCIETVVGPL
ncbi:response regulator [Sulfitobacter pseudonitzschiae]|uniref:Response regulator n=1 Tax=Pseudosulfitobacter pseudonitzschiae TaxID=1402135 RepID=A0A9Q2NL69_9RHOB|nr:MULTISPECIES: response regulator [Roseobacteraceae]MBM2290907.1 response regulator [Pseudosulfitobacter pseudonitzschiae]MBM2295825.1 response regulator [Pseudosulfitobacter pseudonitzschiae]MBM2300738.1 response regulator [Pseudosulfitobacter pseudonitzschiae]MBM2310522.1 response regulator [Pseudosulfitobacter pseudonitzschiae]MBM2315435.1 response regulator [Pseudosulfitobacter pseudonitzschiae]|tara:strand:+ start:7006 stop:7392 length:387 start_codon:yes stop_codon:yes gene_type:complete